MSLHRIAFRLENNCFECVFVVINNKSSCEIWTIGTDMARFLEYEDPQSEIDCLSYDFKKPWGELQIYIVSQHPSNCTPTTTFISKNGIHHLLRPDKRRSLQMGKWLYNEIYPHFYKSSQYDFNALSQRTLSYNAIIPHYNAVAKENTKLKELISQILLPDAPDVVCYEYGDSIYGGKYYRIASEKIITDNPIIERAMTRSLHKRIRTHEIGAIEVFRMRVAASLEFWERAKTMYPLTFYGVLLCKSTNETTINFMPEQKIRERYRKLHSMMVTATPQIDFIDEDDAVLKSYTPHENARAKLIDMMTAVQAEISKEISKIM